MGSMKFIGLFLVFFSSSPSWGINYFWCEKTENCVKAYGGCGRYFSVHQRFKELYEAKAHKGDQVSNCLAPREIDNMYKFDGKPLCKKNKCLLILPEDKQPKKSEGETA